MCSAFLLPLLKAILLHQTRAQNLLTRSALIGSFTRKTRRNVRMGTLTAGPNPTGAIPGTPAVDRKNTRRRSAATARRRNMLGLEFQKRLLSLMINTSSNST